LPGTKYKAKKAEASSNISMGEKTVGLCAIKNPFRLERGLLARSYDNERSNYFFMVSTAALTVESIFAAAVSTTAAAVSTTAAAVESTLASVVEAELLQAAIVAAIARTANTFFMIVMFFMRFIFSACKITHFTQQNKFQAIFLASCLFFPEKYPHRHSFEVEIFP
jgi:hypothetical protein